ncbi:hypothetical protein FDECE_12856 [Fusarium decemcellulare]|nr:hypothetical protein FDECE_12856 [Fusarium decemcellulare]
MDYTSLATPDSCYVDFCLLPLGTGNVSVAEEIAEVQKVLKASGLKYTLHSAGTTVGASFLPCLPTQLPWWIEYDADSRFSEGPWDEVMTAVGKAHAAVHKRGVVRIQSSARIGSRTDKKQVAEEKVKRVEDILAAGESK